MKKTGRICGVCGDIGQIEKSVAVCKTDCEHRYCAQAPAYQPGIWCCQTCRKKQTEMTERRKSNIGGPTRMFENSKVRFLSSNDVISLNNGTVKRCIKTTTSVAPSIRTAPPSGASTPTQTSMAKSASERLLSSDKMLFDKPASASSSGCKEMGRKLSILKEQVPYHHAPIAWKGSLEVHHWAGNTIVELVAYLPLHVSSKLHSAIEALPTKLHMKMVPHCCAWPKQLKADFPNLDDVGVYLRPSEKSYSLKWIHLLRQLDSRKHALKMVINGCLEFVVHSSQVMVENSQKIGGNYYLWGFFWKRKMRSGSKKKKPDITLSKTSSELGASPEFRTPIAQDKMADILKRNQVNKEVIVDITDVCANNLLEKEVVADTFGVPAGLSGPSVGQELSPMDRQSETSIRGKETQPTYEVAPGCSPFSHIADKESDCMQIFSIIGVGSLEATFEACKNQEEYPEAPRLTDASQIKVECEEEPLIPLPDGLEMPPGFSREVETRKEKSISSQQLESPPCFDTLDQVLIKQEKEPFDPQPGGLEIPSGFIRRIKTREESNISDECKGSSLSRIKALNVPRSVPDNFMDKPLLENQGIVHQQTSVGQPEVFSYPVIQGTETPSYNAQPTNPGGQRAIQEVSLSHSQTILDASFDQMVARSQNETHCLSAALHNANARAPTGVPHHFRVFHPSFLARIPRDAYHPSVKEALDITATARGEGSERETARQSPLLRRERRSRSPVPRRERSKSKSPQPRRHRSRSTSPVPRRRRSRSKSPVPRRRRSRSRSSSRWYQNPVYGWNGNGNGSRGRSPVRPCNLYDSGRYSSQYKSRYRSRSRGEFQSFDYPVSRRGRHRSRSFSPPPPVDSS